MSESAATKPFSAEEVAALIERAKEYVGSQIAHITPPTDSGVLVNDLLALLQRLARERDAWKESAQRRGKSVMPEVVELRQRMETAERELAEAKAAAEKARDALQRIAEWDCLNPPDASLCADHPWLKRLVDAALRGGKDT